MRFSSMPHPSVAKLALALALALATAPLGFSNTVVGSIVLTGQDPDFHAAVGGNTTGAINFIQDSMKFITDPAFNTFSAGGINQFLYVEGRAHRRRAATLRETWGWPQLASSKVSITLKPMPRLCSPNLPTWVLSTARSLLLQILEEI